MKMNVLQIANYSAPYKGNFISSLEFLHNQMDEKNNKLVYMFPDKAKQKDWVKELSKSRIVYFYTDNIFNNIILLGKIIKKNNINFIHVHFRNIKIGLPATLAHMFFRKTIYFTHLHGMYIKKLPFKEYIRRFTSWGTYYIGCSKVASDQAIDAGLSKNKIFSAENSINFSRLNEAETLNNADFGLNSKTKKVLMFGYDWYIKGVDLALEAVEKIYEDKREIALLISVAANQDKLEELIINKYGKIPNWVVFLEPRNDIASYYNFTDVFISPSRLEGFCYSLVEAAYCKVPVVASQIPAQKNLKLIGDVWVEPSDVQSLKEGIEKSLELKDPQFLEKQKNIIVDNYQLKRWSDDILEIYDEALKLKQRK